MTGISMAQAAEESSMERTLAWDDGAVVAIDQCASPVVYRTRRPTSVDDVIDAIVRLAIRGASAIGVAGGGQPRVERTSGARSAGGFSPWIDLRPYLPTVSAAAEHALWQRIPQSAPVKVLPDTAFACREPGWFRLYHATDTSTVATDINRLIQALETS